jgi:hypothetical protein
LNHANTNASDDSAHKIICAENDIAGNANIIKPTMTAPRPNQRMKNDPKNNSLIISSRPAASHVIQFRSTCPAFVCLVEAQFSVSATERESQLKIFGAVAQAVTIA